MPILYKFITGFLALTGCISLLITGEMNPLVSLSGIAIIPGYYRFLTGKQHASRAVISILSSMALLVFLFDSVAISGDVFLAVAHLTITFQALKSFDLKEPWDHLQVYFMSLLQLIIASELTYSLAFGIVFILFIIMLVTAMILSHFLKEGSLGKISIKSTVVFLSILTLLTTVVIFIALPRTTKKFLGKSYVRSIQTAGFSERVDFGSFGDVKLDPTVVMRIEMDRDIKTPFYWGGITLDYFDGLSWKSTVKKRQRIKKLTDEFIITPYEKKSAVEQKIFLEPIDSDIIFGLPEISGVKVDKYSLMVDNAIGIYLYRKASRRVNYKVYSMITEGYKGSKDKRYLQLPEGMDKIIAFAGDITSNAKTDYQKAVQIEQYLKKNYIYSLTTSSPQDGMSPIEDFIFNTKRGFCEHYATSMSIMLRGLGIHSRIVNGFHGGKKNDYGDYIIVRQSDAHSWVEALIDGRWRRFDPTPSVLMQYPSEFTLFLDSLILKWSRYVIGFSSSDQREIIEAFSVPLKPRRVTYVKLREISSILYFISALTILILFYFIFTRMRFKRYGFVTEKYIVLRKLMKKKGFKITPSMTSGDLMKGATNLQTGRYVEEFIKLYEMHRFGQKEMSQWRRRKYISLLRDVQKNNV
jgi:transglutaminase-like putative cysteine protease